MKLSDVVDITQLKALLKSFEAAFDIPCSIVDAGEPIFDPEKRHTICSEFHAPNTSGYGTCTKNYEMLQATAEAGKVVTTQCSMGFYDIALPVMVENQYAGAIVIGQFHTKEKDEATLAELAKQLERPVEELRPHYEELPVIDDSRLLAMGAFFKELSGLITSLGQDNIRLAHAKETLRLSGKSLECEVTERTRELELSERRLKDAQHMAHMGSFEQNLDTDQSWGSDELYRLLGLSSENSRSIEEELRRVVHPEDLEAYQKTMDDGLKKGDPFTLEFRIVTGQGKIRWLYAELYVDKDDFGKAIRYRGAFRNITQRKRIEDELRNVNKLQQLILDNNIIGIALVRRRRFDWVNQRAADMAGLTVGEMTGELTRIVFTDDEQYEFLDKSARSALTAGNGYDAVFEFKHVRKGPFWCRFVATALNPEDIRQGIIWMIEDISEQRAAEIELRKSRFELETIFSNSQVGIMLLRGGRILARGNQRLADILGYETPRELRGLSMQDLHVSEREYQQFGERHYNKLIDGEQIQIEYRLKRKDGEAVWCSLSGKAVDTGVPPLLDKGVIWVVDDITERKKAEKALRLSERRFRAIFTHAGVGICTLDRKGLIHRANHRMCMLVDYEEYALLGMNIAEMTHPDDVARGEELRSRLWMGDIPMYVREERYVRRDGNEVWGRVTTTVVRADDNRPQYILQVIEDITERKRLESELVRLARTDSLTGLKNRHYFMERGNEEFERHRRYGTPMSALLMDIDHFKRINDTYGHHNGDLVLKKLAETCNDIMRKTDVFGRIGGEEFAMVLVETTADVAFEIAERIRRAIEDTPVATEDGEIRFTVSIGATDVRPEDQNLEKTLQRADASMYEAKKKGRNRVVLG